LPRDRIRLAILVSHPIQYFAPVYEAIAAGGMVDLTVVFRTCVGLREYHDPGFGQAISWDIPLLDGYRNCFLSRKTTLHGIELSIIPWLIRERPEALLLHGYNQPTNLLALFVGKLLRIEVLMRGDTRLPRTGLQRGLKTAFKRLLFRSLDGFISIGRANAAYYQALGVPPAKVHLSPLCVRNAFFAMTCIDRRIARDSLRAELGVPRDAIVILFASKLLARKRASDLVAAFNKFAANTPDAWLWMAGSGPEEAALKQMAVETGRIRFLGFRNQSELPKLYAASDVFVLPSEDEPWGLVVNEVMAAGLPVVVTDDVGAAYDLVEAKDSGFVYPVGDINRLADVLRALVLDPARRKTMGRNAQTLIARWDVNDSAAGIVRAVQACLVSRK
jgi:glycosyltransferase involved in cell wall biosynthesis